jgi:glutaryl-CoA dehydrogenase
VSTDLYAIEELLSEAECAIRDQVRLFADKEILPVINDYWERAEFPFELLEPMSKLEIWGGTTEGYGCPGLSAVGAGLVQQELARADGSISTFYGVQSGLTMRSIGMLGSEEQKQRFLPGMAALETIGAFALTEPRHGSDAVMLETTARRSHDGYVLDGDKRWIGNASIADVIVVWARADDGEVSGFLVEKGAEGLSTEVIEHKLSKRAVWQADIRLESVRVSSDARLVGAESFKDTARVLTESRLSVAWGALGHALAAYEAAVAHARERIVFGGPLERLQLVQDRLARMLEAITSMQLIAFRASQLEAQGKLTPARASLAKRHNAARSRALIADARDLLGGDGILLDLHVARHQADMESVVTYEGTDAIQGLIVGQEITGVSAFAPR